MKNMNNKNKKVGSLDATRKHPAYGNLLDIMSARVKLAVEINEARAAKCWSQEKLAKEARTTQKVISKVESGNTNVGFDLLRRIASCLNLAFQVGKTVFASKTEATTNVLNQNKEIVENKYVLVFAQVEKTSDNPNKQLVESKS